LYIEGSLKTSDGLSSVFHISNDQRFSKFQEIIDFFVKKEIIELLVFDLRGTAMKSFIGHHPLQTSREPRSQISQAPPVTNLT
jgi:hypothetical protein